MSMPTSTCWRTTSWMPLRMASASALRSYGCSMVRAFMPRRMSTGRTRLPTCVVRSRSILRFIQASSGSWLEPGVDEVPAAVHIRRDFVHFTVSHTNEVIGRQEVEKGLVEQDVVELRI